MPLWQPTQAVARPEYYDRIAVGVLADYSAVVAPHAVVTRWTYTPPGDYAAFVESCNLFAYRLTAAAGAVLATGRLEFLPFYGGTYLVTASVVATGLANDSDRRTVTSLGYMAFGDTLRFTTQDASVGGTVLWQGSFKGTEFLY
jgi:hypothetical protein